jgi:hypothetical protein
LLLFGVLGSIQVARADEDPAAELARLRREIAETNHLRPPPFH